MERYIKKFRNAAQTVADVLHESNIRKGQQVDRIIEIHLVNGLGSDQDFFEAINWFAVCALQKCCVMSLRCSRKYEYELVCEWNAKIKLISTLL